MRDIILDSFRSNVTDAAKEFSGAPKMPFPEIRPKPSMLAEKFISTKALKQVKGFAHTHRVRDFNKTMHVVRHNLKFIKLHAVTLNSFAQDCFAILPHPRKLKTIPAILRLPHKVEAVLPNSVGKICCFHFASGKERAHANTNRCLSGAAPLATHSYFNIKRKRLLFNLGLKAEEMS